MSVIDRGSRTQPKPDVRQCRCGRDTLWLYATVGLLHSHREHAHTNAGLLVNFREAPDPSRGRIVTLLAVKRQISLTASINKFLGGFILVRRAFNYFRRYSSSRSI